jgi:hypothetical protein
MRHITGRAWLAAFACRFWFIGARHERRRSGVKENRGRRHCNTAAGPISSRETRPVRVFFRNL